jgi:hypothetical protein
LSRPRFIPETRMATKPKQSLSAKIMAAIGEALRAKIGS